MRKLFKRRKYFTYPRLFWCIFIFSAFVYELLFEITSYGFLELIWCLFGLIWSASEFYLLFLKKDPED